MLDTSGCVCTWNKGAEQIKGYRPEEIIGKHFSIFYTGPDREKRHPELVLEQSRKYGRYEEEGWRLRKDGTYFWASVVITPVCKDGTLIGFTKVTRDLTERKLAERQKVEKEALVDKIRKNEDLIAALSHDIKNPLIGSKRLLEIMLNQTSETTNQSQDLLTSIKIGVDDALSLTQNLIDACRIDINQAVFSIQKTDFKNLIFRSINSCKAMALIRNVEITVDLPSEELFLNVDPEAMRRVIQNLLNNGIKFASVPGNVDIRIKNADPSKLTIEIEDDGPGISENEKGLLFCRFSQGPLGKRHAGGTGLGLYICKRIVEAHQGEIKCVSSGNTGAIFKIDLPKYGILSEPSSEHKGQ